MTDMGSARSHLQTFSAFLLFLSVPCVRLEVVGKAGGAVELECSFPPSDPAVDSGSPYVVEWVRQGLDIPVLISYGPFPSRVHPQYEGRVSLVRVTALRLGPLQLEDQGLYECRVLLLDRPTGEPQNGTWTLLSVTAPPTFIKAPPPVVEALVGSPLSLACVANGNPAPTITWLKDGEVAQTDRTLSVSAVSTQSAGQYTCRASNSQGNVSHTTRVNIKGPPVIIIPPKSTSLNMSQNALLQCQAVADPPNMTYVWHKGEENVYHIDSLKSRVKIMVDGTLLISRLIPEDSGRYTCMPTNGLLTPPTASANLTVMHAAKALETPEETYLPTGKDGLVTCPAAAQPPLLRVEWMKDGEPLDLSLFPGWTLTPEGSLLMATVNDDAAGLYTCTPYNSYGTMGPSKPIKVKLQDPPSFSVAPEAEYKQEVGRSLFIPCQANKDPTVKVTWSKVDIARRVAYSITPNGSLLLQPVTKDHQGSWECCAANRVASVTTRTQVFVLGTSPHTATALAVSAGLKQANVSWEAGFDGGSPQTFSVWVKRTTGGDNDGKQEWFSVPVPPSSGASHQVTGLSPAMTYQFSVLSHNKIGTGPFSEIVTARTLDLRPRKSKLKPPAWLLANRDSAGVHLQWSPPEDQYPPITAYVLQSRTEEGEWLNLDEDISGNSSELVVPGLHKDCVYELRLLSRRGELLSEPGPSVNVSTLGMDVYPATSRLLEFIPEPLLAGVLGGVAFMCLALVLLLGAACLISHKRERRRQKRRDEPPPAISKPSIKASGSGSPDSVLKKSLLPSNNLYPTTSSTSSSCSSQTGSYSSENKVDFYSTGRLTRTTSSPVSPAIEMISRGPDGRFILQHYDTLSVNSQKSTGYDPALDARRSISLHSDADDQKEPAYVLSVDLPPCKPIQSTPHSHIYPMVQLQKPTFKGLPDFSSLCSNSSLATLPHPSPSFPVLPHIRSGFGQSSTTASTLVLQMEHEREKGNLSRCLKLAREREELERELRRYARDSTDDDSQEDNVDMWKYKSNTLPHKAPQGSTQHHPGSFFSTSLLWEARRLVSPPPTPIPHMTRFGSVSPSCFKQERLPCAALSAEEAERFCKDRLTLPHLSSKSRRHERVEAAPEGYDNSTNSTVLEMQTNDSCSEARRQNNLRHASLSTLSFQTEKYPGRSHLVLGVPPASSKATNEDVEMSVDEPELGVHLDQPAKPMLHQRIASHVQQGCALSRKGQFHTIRRSKSLNSRSPLTRDEVIRSPQATERDNWTDKPKKFHESKQRSQSLDSRRRKERNFLTPDAWINSLSQENCSGLAPCRPASLVWETKSSTNRVKSPGNFFQIQVHSPRERLTPNHSSLGHYEPRRETSMTHDYNYQEAMKAAGRYLEEIKKPFFDDHDRSREYEGVDIDAGGFEGVPKSGSYSSYASSGRGSMDPPNNRLSLCHISPTPTSSPARIEEVNTVGQMDPNQSLSRRKASVDENYEWDAVDVSSQLGEHDGLLPPLPLQKPTLCFSPPSVHCSTAALKNCADPSALAGRQSSARAEPETVLF